MLDSVESFFVAQITIANTVFTLFSNLENSSDQYVESGMRATRVKKRES